MRVDLIADGIIASTHIVERLLATAFGQVRIIAGDSLGASPPDADLLVLSRLCNPRLSWLPDYFAAKEQRYVYFLDDNLFELTDKQDVSNAAYYGHPAVRSTLLKFLRGAALIWVMSPALRNYLRDELLLENVCFLPAPVDMALFAQTDEVVATQPGAIRVGYPTSRRLNVADLLVDLVNRAEERYGDSVQFEFVGWCPDKLLGRPNVCSFPHMPDYGAFARFVVSRGWTAALAPVSDSLFENCKTSVKYREYAAARVAGIYSNTPLYRHEVRDGYSGLLVSNDPDAWIAAVNRLLVDHALRRGIVDNAYQDVRSHHEQGAVAGSVRDVLGPFTRAIDRGVVGERNH